MIQAEPRRRPRGTHSPADGPEYAHVLLDQIEPDPALARWSIDEERLGELAQSLERREQISPIAVRRVSRDKYLIICGERRWRAASRDPRIRTVPCLIFNDLTEADALLMRLADYLSQEDFQLLELGEMIARVQGLLGWSLRRLTRELGVKHDQLRRPLAMLRLPPETQDMVRRRELKQSHAYQISRAPAGERQAIAEKVVREGLTHEQTLALVRRRRAAMGMGSRPKRRRWTFSAPGDCRIVVTTPPGTGRSVVRQALVAVLARLLGPRRGGNPGTGS